jgi:hypothetical protein
MSHRHCIFCGISSDAGGMVGAICMSKNNTAPVNTVGDKPHVYLLSGWDTQPSDSPEALREIEEAEEKS